MSRTTSHRRQRTSRAGFRAAPGVRGFSLIELMIALMLGLLVVGSASAIFISNRQTYRATEGLGRVQENGRMAFELLSRDLREAGSSPCGNADRDAFAERWSICWSTPQAGGGPTGIRGISGYEGGEASPGTAFGTPCGSRVAGTDADRS